MKILSQSLFLLALICFSLNIQGQSNILKGLEQNEKIDFIHAPVPLDHFFTTQFKTLGLSADSELKVQYSLEDVSGYTRNRFKQFYKGLEVIGSSYILHSKNQLVYKSTGILVPYIAIETARTTDIQLIHDKALDNLSDHLKSTEAILEQTKIEWQITGQRKCIINEAFPKLTGDYVLAYELILEGKTPNQPFIERVYINANDASWINHSSDIINHTVPAQVETKYYGTQSLLTDSISPNLYQLVDSTRGVFIRDFSNSNQTVKDTDNYWAANEKGHVAGDAHYCTSAYHDYMQSHFNWSGIDGQGGDLLVNINQNGKYYVNAFWNGSYAAFGNGDCHRFSALTTLDVVGHEFTHGFIDYTSDLIYQDQSGALNESSADIFGKALEYKYDQANFNWLIGDRFTFGIDASAFRDMSDPHSKNDPCFYGGQHYYTGAGDRGGVHSNSGVTNYWFYLLVEGKQDTNEAGYNYNVQALGMDKVMDIMFGMHVGYLTPGSSFIDAFNASLAQTVDLYGLNSMEYNNVIEAWKAVGIDLAIDQLDLSIESDVAVYDVCPDELVYVQVTVRNQGTQAFPSGEIISLQYQQRNDFVVNEDYQLSQDLNPGDSINYTFIQELQDSITHDGTMTISLIANDTNVLNNSDESSCKSSNTTGLDMGLINFRFTLPTCERTQITNVSYTLRNTGCETISQGDSVLISYVAGSTTRSFSKILNTDLVPGGYLGGSENLISNPIPIDFTDYEAQITYLNDGASDNNDFEGQIALTPQIIADYFEDFENFNTADYGLNMTTSYVEDSILIYQGNKMLAIAGKRVSPSFANCAELEDFFDVYNFTTKMNFCIDAGTMQEPQFSFNHIQLRNESFSSQTIDLNYGVIIQVKTDSMTYPLIHSLEEGVMTHQKFELPYGYFGPLEIEILTNSGPTDPFANLIFDNTDVALFDEFRLIDKSQSSLSETEESAAFFIFPNPTVNQLNIYSKLNTKDYELKVHNNLGHHISSYQGKGDSSFDIAPLSSGIYFISIFVEGRLIDTEKLLKL